MNLNALPAISNIIDIRDKDGQTIIALRTNRYSICIAAGAPDTRNLCSSMVEGIYINKLTRNKDYFSYEYSWNRNGWNKQPTDEIQNLAIKMVQYLSDISWKRRWGKR